MLALENVKFAFSKRSILYLNLIISSTTNKIQFGKTYQPPKN